MFAKLFGIPAIIVATGLAYHFFYQEWDALDGPIAALCGLMIGLVLYCLARGLDILGDRKLDNPPPYFLPQQVPEAFGIAREQLSLLHYGPHNWNVKSASVEDCKIMAALQFFEDGGPGLQFNRRILLELVFEPVSDAEKEAKIYLPSGAIKAQTKMTLRWFIDSKFNRWHANNAQEQATDALLVALQKKKAKNFVKSPFHIPYGIVIACMLTAGIAFDDYVRVSDAREKMKQQAAQSTMQQYKSQVNAPLPFESPGSRLQTQSVQSPIVQTQTTQTPTSSPMSANDLSAYLESQRRMNPNGPLPTIDPALVPPNFDTSQFQKNDNGGVILYDPNQSSGDSPQNKLNGKTVNPWETTTSAN